MSDIQAFICDRIFDGHAWHENAALLVEFGYVAGIVAQGDVPTNAKRVELGDGMVVPGFIDLQVNGGGGILFNNAPTLDSIRAICQAHHQFGTTGLMPTLITDTAEINELAIAAGVEADAARVPGFLGLHLEGPHLSLARKGTHDPKLIRPMDPEDEARLCAAAEALPKLICTVAAETVPPEQIERLVAAGAIVSIGHSDAPYAVAMAAFKAGASMATHLFNAMSQLGSREPGVVGAVLDSEAVTAGLIADGIHVHPAAIGSALRAKRSAGKIFLVTDAMSQTGTDLTEIILNGRTITRAEGALRLADGTLAGADLDMIDAVNYMIDVVGLEAEEVFRMASLYAAQALGAEDTYGHLGARAAGNFVHMSAERSVRSTWINGEQVFAV